MSLYDIFMHLKITSNDDYYFFLLIVSFSLFFKSHKTTYGCFKKLFMIEWDVCYGQRV